MVLEFEIIVFLGEFDHFAVERIEGAVGLAIFVGQKVSSLVE